MMWWRQPDTTTDSERYRMAINHLREDHDLVPKQLTLRQIDNGSADGFELYEIMCICGWWDHWDERVIE